MTELNDKSSNKLLFILIQLKFKIPIDIGGYFSNLYYYKVHKWTPEIVFVGIQDVWKFKIIVATLTMAAPSQSLATFFFLQDCFFLD